jgi:hypothetical protein
MPIIDNIYNTVNLNIRSIDKQSGQTITLENIVKMTVEKLANEKGENLNFFLKGHTVKEIADNIKKYGKKSEDANPIIILTINHAEQLINKYAKTGKMINFSELIEIMKKNPEKNISEIFAYAIAKQDPALAQFAEKMVNQKASAVKEIDNPHLYFGGLKIEKLDPKEIYKNSNDEDAEYFKLNSEKIKQNKDEIRRKNYIRLANLQLQKRENSEEFTQAKLQEALAVAG